MNIDIHCHSSTKVAMQTNKPLSLLFKGFSFVPESSLLKKTQKFLEKATGVLGKTQSHFDSMYKGGVRVAIISFTPMEKGFNIINNKQGNFFTDVMRDLATRKRSDILISPKIINALTGYDIAEIEKVQDGLTDYYLQALKPEHDLILSYKDKQGKVGDKNYTLRFPRNATELKKQLKDDSNLCILLSIEGMHSVMPAPTNLEVYKGQKNTKGDNSNKIDNDLLGVIKLRIDEMKNQWLARPVFVSLNHHFYNRLGGHASSLGRLITKLVNQDEGLNTSLTANGEEVIKALLKDTPIYIDIKHKSVLARMRYYELLKNDKELKKKKYPIICSHTGISSYDTLQQLKSLNEEIAQENPNNFLYESGINLCKEELDLILQSEGIVGIQLDEKRIAGKKAVAKLKKAYQAKGKLWELYIKLVWANIFQGVRALGTQEAWNIFSIGSDYDGLINHLDEYPLASNFNTLRKDMLDFLKGKGEIVEMDFSLTREEINKYMFDYTAEQLVEKVFEGNALRFLERWYV